MATDHQKGFIMCSPATCPSCGKATWTGCGNHVDSALRGIPEAQRCQGHATASASSGGLGSRLFGR